MAVTSLLPPRMKVGKPTILRPTVLKMGVWQVLVLYMNLKESAQQALHSKPSVALDGDTSWTPTCRGRDLCHLPNITVLLACQPRSWATGLAH